MKISDFKNITDIDVFKQKLIDYDNWHMNIVDESEEDLDEEIALYIQKKYQKFLSDIWNNESKNTQLYNVASFIYCLNY